MQRLLWVCLGGALGSGARYLVSGWMLATLGPAFPFGTLAVNVVGSFLLAALVQVTMATDLISPTLYVALAGGVLGGFTTYSAFSYETFQYLQHGVWRLALLNVVVTVLGCLGGCVLGFVASRAVVGPAPVLR